MVLRARHFQRVAKLLRLESHCMQPQLLLAESSTGSARKYPQNIESVLSLSALNPAHAPLANKLAAKNTCFLWDQVQQLGTSVPRAAQCLSPCAWARAAPPGPLSRRHCSGAGQRSAGQQWALQRQHPAQVMCPVWRLVRRSDRGAVQGLLCAGGQCRLPCRLQCSRTACIQGWGPALSWAAAVHKRCVAYSWLAPEDPTFVGRPAAFSSRG